MKWFGYVVNWRNWDRNDWNTRLLRAVFGISAHGEGPVRTIDTTSPFLASVAAEPSAREDSVQKHFLDCYHLEPKAARELFDEKIQLPRGAVATTEQPSFFGQLYLSCIAASATEETQDEGNFRVRLATIIGLDPDADYLNRRGLATLWEALEDWSERVSETGRPLRPLVLPEPGHETIIGYSKRLAFPSHKDLNLLATVIGQHDMSEDSAVSEILRALEQSRRKFSDRFQIELDAFRRAVASTNSDPSETLLWSAFQAATWKPRRNEQETSPPLHLALRVDKLAELECLVAGEPSSEESETWRFHAFPREADDCRGELTLPNDASIARPLLDGAELEGFRLGYLRRLVEQGCIPFGRGETLPWISRRTLPTMGSSWLLLRRDRAEYLKAILESKVGHLGRRDVAGVPDWCLTGPIPSADAEQLRGSYALRKLDAFQRTLGGRSIRLKDAVRLDSGCLFLRPRLPKVGVVDADKVSIFHKKDHKPLGELTEDSQDSDYWRFTGSLAQRVSTPGELLIWAHEGGGVVAGRTLRVVGFSPTIARDPALPPGRFAAATRFGQIGSIDDLSVAPIEESASFQDGAPEVRRFIRDLVRERPGISSSAVSSRVYRWRSIEAIPQLWWDLLEVLHALCLNRSSGLNWLELLEICREGFGLGPEEAVPLAENLVQNGLVRKLYSLKSPGTRFVASPPAVSQSAEPGELRISGILGKMGLAKLRRWAKARRVRLEVAVLGDFEAVGVLRIVSTGELSASELPRILEIVVADVDTDSLHPPLEFLRHTSRRIDLDAKPLETKPWNTRSSRMRSSGLRVETGRFGDRPNQFVFTHDGRPFWATQSVSWAVLVTRFLCEREPWRLDPHGMLTLSHAAPPVFAARITRRGGGVCGALWKNTSSRLHFYPFGSRSGAEQWLGEWVRREARVPSPNLARWARSIQGNSTISHARRSAFERRYSRILKGTER